MQNKNVRLFAVILFCTGLVGLQCKPNRKEQTLKDVDGNIYQTIKIGTQFWMAGNLRTTRFNDGTSIPLVTDATAWERLSTPGYCWYNNDAATYQSAYGAIYNWYTVNNTRLCPSGWHVPTYYEWGTLTNYLGVAPESVNRDSIGKIKAADTNNWIRADSSINKRGFTSLPGGYRNDDGSFSPIGDYCRWWMSAEWNIYTVWGPFITYGYSGGVNSFVGIRQGFSVRCIRD
jgi:uncharacterized protein (TIGR02145 family)